MDAQSWVTRATAQLRAADIATARLDCLVLLEDACGRDRSWLLAHPEFELSPKQATTLDEQIARRAGHEPLAYIRGHTEFYGREFIINQHVLEPRPETETMIDLLKALPLDARKNIVDVGTGSGTIAITAALELGECTVLATDIDPACLDVARQNCEQHKATVNLFEGDLLTPVADRLEPGAILLCNLPYVPNGHQLNKAAMNEPRLAIFGGEDGLDLYRRLFQQIDSLAHKPTHILTESLPFQHEALAELAQQHGYEVSETNDFIQSMRLV
jgi:release factor glutamine methyltransferase